MSSIRRYLPLIGFVVPTLVIGYGIVIPHSCIAGVNELSVGFGTTVLGAALAYIAGIRAVTPRACPAQAPLHVRLARYVNAQASRPRGAFGRVLGIIWSFEHRCANRRTLDLLEIAAADRVLEVGAGPGLGVSEAARRAKDGHVAGLDVSEVMVAAARRRNRDAERAGRVDVALVRGDDLGLAPEHFDRAFSIHCIYFWDNPRDTLRQIARSLRPGARLILTFRADSPDLPARYRDPTYRFYSPLQVERMLAATGFERIRVTDLGECGRSVVPVQAERGSNLDGARAGSAPSERHVD